MNMLLHTIIDLAQNWQSVPRGQKRNAKDQDPGAQDKIVDSTLASKWVKIYLGGTWEPDQEGALSFQCWLHQPITVLLSQQVS